MLIQARPATDPELAALIPAQLDDAQYLVGVLDRRVVACGALRAIEPRTGEIRQLYVRPAFRRRGIARQLLAALEELALDAGHTVLRLEIGGYLPMAAALCYSAGYAAHPGGPDRIRFEKHILVAA